MYAVTINTGRHVRIIFFQQRAAMHTFCIFIKNGTVALFTGMRNSRPGYAWYRGIMRAVAICTDGRICIPVLQRGSMHTVHRFIEKLHMTILTSAIHSNCEVAGAFCFCWLVGENMILVTIVTFEGLPRIVQTVDRCVESIFVNCQGYHVAIGESLDTVRLTMTGKAII